MTRKTPNTSAASASFARQSMKELAALRRAMREAEDNLAGLHRMLKAPVPKGGSRTIRGSSKRFLSPLLTRLESNLTSYISRDIVNSLSGDYAPSAAQSGADLASALQQGQRIS